MEIKGVAHFYTTHSKGLKKYIEDSELIAIEGAWNTTEISEDDIEVFIGKEGFEIVKEKEKMVTAIDPVIKDENYKKRFILKNLSFNFMLSSITFLSFMKVFGDIGRDLVTSLTIGSSIGLYELYKQGKDNERFYQLFLNATTVYRFFDIVNRADERDIGMAYSLKKLDEKYENVLGVVGNAHKEKISTLLKDTKRLKQLYEENRDRFIRKELEIYRYYDDFKLVDRIKL